MRTELIYDMPESRYLADPCDEPSLNASTARELINGSARRAYRNHPKLGGKTRAHKLEFDEGKLVHELLLGAGGGYEICNVTYDAKHKTKSGEVVTDWATNAAKEWKAACRFRGHVPVLECEIEPVRYAADAIRSRLAEDFSIELTGDSEVVALWTEGTTGGGVQCRARLDHWDKGNARIVELKTCKSAHPKAVLRDVENFGYDIQAEAQIRAIERIHSDLAGRVEFCWVFCELVPPYEVAVYYPDGEMRQYAEMLWLRAVERWSECRRRDRWPGYVEHRRALSPSPWRMRELEDYEPPSSDTEPAPPQHEEYDDAESRAIF